MIEFLREGSHRFTVLRRVRTSNSEGFLLAHFAVPAGLIRIAWLDPASGIVYRSRAVRVT